MNRDNNRARNTKHVWLSRTLLSMKEEFGFSCHALETAKNEFIDLIWRFELGKEVSGDELPKIMWCSNDSDNRKKRLPHLFKANGFFIASQEMKDVLEAFDLGASCFIPVQLLHSDKKTPWPGTHYFLYMPDRVSTFDPEHSRRYKPNRYDDDNHVGTIPWDITDNDISVRAEALTGQDMWQDNSLLWSLFFTDASLEAIRRAGLMGDMQVTRCPVAG